MGNLIVRQVIDDAEWDAYMSEFSASPFLSRLWLEPFANDTLKPVCYRFIENNETIGFTAGLVQIPRYTALKIVKLYRSLMFFSGPYVKNQDPLIASRCLKAFFTEARKMNFTKVRYRSWDYPCDLIMDEVFPFPEAQRIEYIFDISNRDIDPHANMNRNQRRKVKLAIKNNVQFLEDSSKKRLFEVLPIIMGTKDIRVNKGRKEYDHYYITYLNDDILQKHVKNGIGRVFVSEVNGKAESAIILIASGDRGYGILAGTSQHGYDIGASSFTILNTLRTLQKEGLKYFNLGGLPSGDSGVQLEKFKIAMGASDLKCIGGSTDFLQGIHQKIPIEILKKIKGRKG